MSVDAGRVVNIMLSFHELWSLPLQMAVALYLLYLQVRTCTLLKPLPFSGLRPRPKPVLSTPEPTFRGLIIRPPSLSATFDRRLMSSSLTGQVHYAFIAGLVLSVVLIPVNRWISQRILAASTSMMESKVSPREARAEFGRGPAHPPSSTYTA